MEWLKGYQSDIIAFWLGIAKILVNVGIASILSLYLLIGKNKLLKLPTPLNLRLPE